MHDRRIAHRVSTPYVPMSISNVDLPQDICNYNMVINRYRIDQNGELLKENLRQHRVGDDVFYAFMDYDQSIRLPQECSVRHCQRPAHESAFGAMIYKPRDTDQGEPTYNPFAFDVAMLGNVFRFHFWVRLSILFF